MRDKTKVMKLIFGTRQKRKENGQNGRKGPGFMRKE